MDKSISSETAKRKHSVWTFRLRPRLCCIGNVSASRYRSLRSLPWSLDGNAFVSSLFAVILPSLKFASERTYSVFLSKLTAASAKGKDFRTCTSQNAKPQSQLGVHCPEQTGEGQDLLLQVRGYYQRRGPSYGRVQCLSVVFGHTWL